MVFRRIHHHHRFMVRYSVNLLRSFTRPVLVYLFFLAMTVMGGFSALFYWVEGDVNHSINGWFDAFYFTVMTMTSVGYGDIVPVTDLGKFVSVLMMLMGTAIYAAFTGVIASSLLEFELRK